MAAYGSPIRTPGATRRDISSNDPQQQALLDAMQQNGLSDPNQSIDRLPQLNTAGPSRTTQPVPTNQPPAPTGGIGTNGGLAPPGQYQSTPPANLGSQGSGLSLKGLSGNANQAPSAAWAAMYGNGPVDLSGKFGLTGPGGNDNLPKPVGQQVGGMQSGGLGSAPAPPQMPRTVNGQDALNALAPPSTGSIDAAHPNVTPLDLSNAYNQQLMSQAPPAQQAAAQPGYTPPNQNAAPGGLGQYSSSLEGFDSGKLNDPNKHDAKYDFARIASNYPPTPAGLQQAMSQIQQLYPNAQLIGDDKVDFGDGYGPVDVIRAAGDGGKAWHFEGQDSGGAAATGGGAKAQGDPLTQLTQLQSGADGGDTYSKLVLQYLMQQLGLDGAMMQNSK